MQMQLANPALIFIYSLVLLLFGCEIGCIGAIVLESPSGLRSALVMVIHNLVAGFIWMGITGKWTQAVRKKAEQKSEGSTQLGRSR